MRPLPSFCAALLLGCATTHGALYTSTIGPSILEEKPAAVPAQVDLGGPGSAVDHVYLGAAPIESSLASGITLDAKGYGTLSFSGGAEAGSPMALTGWSLGVTPVPEPVNTALGILGGVFLVVGIARSQKVRAWLRRHRAAAKRWVNAV